jgi:formylmethanofuran dehydrogenase subunit E
MANPIPDRGNNPKRTPKKTPTCFSCGTKVNEDEGYHLVDGAPVCPSCMEEHERG